MEIVRTVSDNIHIEFGLDKLKMFVLDRRKSVHSQNLKLHCYREKQ